MWILLSICIGICTPATPIPEGGLVYTSLQDCETTKTELDGMFGPKSMHTIMEGGKAKMMTKDEYEKNVGYRIESRCAKSYFADYAQTERLTDGRVTCSYETRMPESIMARRLDPYAAGYCKGKKPPTSSAKEAK